MCVDVLVVDDDEVVRSGVERILSREGLTVAVARSATAALAHPAAETARLVLCDLMLPDATGLDLVRAFEELRPGRPVVVMTGYRPQAALAREIAGRAVLDKPFDADELLAVVRAALPVSGGVL
jgi:DNA-binding NtrC family response regulator